jgi:hypothetical protein
MMMMMSSPTELVAYLTQVSPKPCPRPLDKTVWPPAAKDMKAERDVLAHPQATLEQRITAALRYYAWVTVMEEQRQGRDFFARYPSHWTVGQVVLIADTSARERFMVCAILAALHATTATVASFLAASELYLYQGKLLRSAIRCDTKPWSKMRADEYEGLGQLYHLLALQLSLLDKRGSEGDWVPLARHVILEADRLRGSAYATRNAAGAVLLETISLVWQTDVVGHLVHEEKQKQGMTGLDKASLAQRLRQWLLLARVSARGLLLAGKEARLAAWFEARGTAGLEAYRAFRTHAQATYLNTQDGDVGELLAHLPKELMGFHDVASAPATFWGQDVLQMDKVTDIFPDAPEPGDFGQRPNTFLQRMITEMDQFRLLHKGRLANNDEDDETEEEEKEKEEKEKSIITLAPDALPAHQFKSPRDERLFLLGYCTHRLQTLQHLRDTQHTSIHSYDKEIGRIQVAIDTFIQDLKE